VAPCFCGFSQSLSFSTAFLGVSGGVLGGFSR
jgi:hypothetical protein